MINLIPGESLFLQTIDEFAAGAPITFIDAWTAKIIKEGYIWNLTLEAKDINGLVTYEVRKELIDKERY